MSRVVRQTSPDIQWTYCWSYTLYDFLYYPMSRVQALQHFPQLLFPSCMTSTVCDSTTRFPLNFLQDSPLNFLFKNPSFVKFIPDSYLTLYTIYVKQGTTGLYKGFFVHLFHLFLNDSLKYILLSTYFTKLDTFIQQTFQWKIQRKKPPFEFFSSSNKKCFSYYLTPLPSYLTPLLSDPIEKTVYLPSTSLCQTTSQIALKLFADFLCYPILSLQTKLLVIQPPILTNPFSLAHTLYRQHGLLDGFYKGISYYMIVKLVEYSSEWMFYYICIPQQKNKRYTEIKTNHFSSLACALTSPLTALSFQQRIQCILPNISHTTLPVSQTTTYATYFTNVFFATLLTFLYSREISN